MHEYNYALKIFKAAEKYALETENGRFLEIKIKLGKESGLSAENICLYFEQISKGGICEGVKLTFDIVEPLLRCVKCGKLFKRSPFSFACSDKNCSGEGEPTEIGKEFEIGPITIKS